MAVDNSFLQNFLAGAEAGRRERAQRQAEADAAEERSVRKITLEAQLKRLKAEDAERRLRLRRGAAGDQFQALQGIPEANVTPDLVDPRDALAQTMRQMPTVPIPTITTPQGETIKPSYSPQAPLRLKPIVQPGDPELGVSETTLIPETHEQQEAQRQARILADLRARAGVEREFAPPARPRVVPIDTTDERGRPVTLYVTEEEALKRRSFPAQPRQTGGAGPARPRIGDLGALREQLTAFLINPTRARQNPNLLRKLKADFGKAGLDWELERVSAAERAGIRRLAAEAQRERFGGDEPNADDLLAVLDEIDPPAPQHGGGGRGAMPPGATAGDNTVTVAELQALAAAKGTSLEQEKRRAIAAGFVVR